MGITELAELVRAGLDEDERLARELAAWADGTGRTGGGAFEFPKLIGDPHVGPFGGQSAIRNWGTGQDIVKLAHPRRVLRDLAARRKLLDQALGWRHDVHDDNWFTCEAATEERDGGTYAETDGGGPCTCGRDKRVLAVLQTLATPYQEQP